VALGPLLATAPELSSSPEIRPTPLDALGLTDMPTELHFVRNHFDVPLAGPDDWVVEIGGAVEQPARLTLDDLRSLPSTTRSVALECAGHRRREFEPAAQGIQWDVGAVAEARWTGVPLEELLLAARPSAHACEVVFEGADRGVHRTTESEIPFARSIPFGRALTGDVLVAWAMNGRPIPAKHGAPIRAIVPGVYAVASVKWLRHIAVVEQPFEGPFQSEDYRMLGLIGAGDGEPLHQLSINALIVTPEAEAALQGGAIAVSGVAWGGRGGAASVEVRLDEGQWQPTTMTTPNPPYGLSHWRAVLAAVARGRHTLEVRAHDKDGFTQPTAPRWNALGYANNSRHVVPVTVI
jgi:DMSO/TMAO reductase YedYZ molybdopterin-dependent catalytic subunit